MEGIEIFPSISLILFFAFFILLVTYLVRTGKDAWSEAANLPFESEENRNPQITQS